MDITSIRKKAIDAVASAFDLKDLEIVYKSFLGKNGELNNLLKTLGSLPDDQRKGAGQSLNLLKKEIEDICSQKQRDLVGIESERKLKSEKIDVTLPGVFQKKGTIHPVTQTINSISDFFGSLGFEVASGPEVETDYYNFEALNVPADHPAKDMHDTFYLGNGSLLRTHTSPVQIRTMEQ